MILRSIAVWLVLVVLAIVNGVTRNAQISPRVGEAAGHMISTFILCILIFLVAFLSIRWIAPKDMRDAFLIGFLWVVLTVAFEFIVGHYVFGNSWESILADYNIFRGRVWLLVLVSSFAAPVIAARARLL